MNEKELIDRCKNDDIDAYEKLILQYEKKIYNICFYVLKNREDAFDITQEVALKIYKSIKTFKGDCKLSTWIYRISHNACLDFLRRKKDVVSYEDVIAADKFLEDNVENTIENREFKIEFKRCVMSLSDDFKTVIILRDIEGLSYQEIAEILNLEIGTVKSRLNRARAALKKELIISGVVRG